MCQLPAREHDGTKTHQLVKEYEESDASLLDALVRASDDNLDVALRLETKADRARDLPDDREVRLGQAGDLVELATHLDLDVLLAVEDL